VTRTFVLDNLVHGFVVVIL